ncbi:MAG: MCE family protein [Actinomycetota bacterium]|nr:MCE family protein [Actinomycetota bacterium]
MTGLLRTLTGRVLGVVVVLVLVAGYLLTLGDDDDKRTVTAHFPRAVSVYEGTDVRILGVNVGRVTAVIPEGNSIRVEMEYDAEHKVPADATAAIVTPTLVADRFIQLGPAYTGGPVLEDDADIELDATGVPVELDRIYAALRDLTAALGPDGVNADGTLNRTLKAGADALGGNGAAGNEMIRNLSEAAVTFGEGSGDLFETVTQLAEFTDTLATNDKLVRAFMADLAGVSASLVTERGELQQALGSVARAVGTVKTFVQDNRQALVTDVEKLGRVMKAINSERDSLDKALTVAPVAIGNLVLAFNTRSGSIGSRIGIDGNIADADGLLCAVVQQSDLPAPSKKLACEIFERLLEPLLASDQKAPAAGRTTAPRQQNAPAGVAPRDLGSYATGDDATLEGLLGGGDS